MTGLLKTSENQILSLWGAQYPSLFAPGLATVTEPYNSVLLHDKWLLRQWNLTGWHYAMTNLLRLPYSPQNAKSFPKNGNVSHLFLATILGIPHLNKIHKNQICYLLDILTLNIPLSGHLVIRQFILNQVSWNSCFLLMSCHSCDARYSL